MSRLARRDFLKVAPAAAGAAVSAIGGRAQTGFPSQAAPASPAISAARYTPVHDYPIRPKRPWEVTLVDRFWKPRIILNAEVTIPIQIEKAAGTARGPSGNVLEAAMLSLRTRPDQKLQAHVDAAVRQLRERPRRGNSGFEAAVTRYQTTGQRDLLDAAIRAADELYEEFRLRNPPFSGGERDALNCVQLYRTTHERRHLDLAKHYLDIRGLGNSVNRSRHNQSYMPVLEQAEAVGHAVNGVTLMVSLVDVGVLTGLQEYFAAGQRLWADATFRKMYITGGVGATGNEGFGAAYALPNISAYAETCAVLMFITLNHRLFMATGDAGYIDVMERGMYNNAVDGVSLTGNRFFYVNRLASAGDGRDARWERASLECCPPNLVRFLASMPGLVYAQDTRTQGIYVNLYVSSRVSFDVRGSRLALAVDSEMPWGGNTRIVVSPEGRMQAAINLRMPGWTRNQPAPGGLYRYLDRIDTPPTVAVNGTPVGSAPDKRGYVSIDRQWSNGDVITIEFPCPPRKVVADDRVVDNRRRMAIERGPIVYCAEWPDVDDGRALDLLVAPNAPLTAVVEMSAIGEAIVLETAARRVTRRELPATRARLIPYHLWANRGVGEMSVWLSTAGYAIGDAGPAGGFIFYENPNHAADGWRYLEAAPFDQSGGAQWGCFRRLIEGARGTAVGTGKQNTADMLAACAEPATAAQLCASLRVNGVGGWFLPSRDELVLMYRHLKAAGIGGFDNGGLVDNVQYWTSSQQTADMAAHVDFADLGRLHGDDKDFPRRVRAIREI
jgi:DUF1680 family protein